MLPSNQIKIENRVIGSGRTFVIAEIGANHCQSLQLAFETIDAAKASGADAVKFQTININHLYYQPSQETIELHRKIDFPEDWHFLIKEYCDKRDITFFSSPTYLKAIDILEKVDVQLYKLASAQVGTFPQLVRKVAATGKPIILSTGLVSYSELERVVKIFIEEKNPNFIILHCNSIYPTPYNKVGLKLMDTYKKMFGSIVGFSDHTEGIYIPIAAVALGAQVIEKHFVLDKRSLSPDAPISIEPNLFKEMVAGIRATEEAANYNSRIDIYDEEQLFKDRITTRLFLRIEKEENEILSAEDFSFLRHKNGIDCKFLENIVGRKLNRSLPAGTPILYSDLA